MTIPAGATSVDIDVAVLDDDLVEATETVTVTLGGITGAAPGISLDDANRTATVSIADDDTAMVSIANISDGAEAATPAVGKFRVTQSKPSSTDTVLSYTVNGTATPGAGDDYTPLSGTRDDRRRDHLPPRSTSAVLNDDAGRRPRDGDRHALRTSPAAIPRSRSTNASKTATVDDRGRRHGDGFDRQGQRRGRRRRRPATASSR